MEKGDVKVIFITDYSNRKKGDEGIFSEDIAAMMVLQKVATIVEEKEEKPEPKDNKVQNNKKK